MRILSRFLILLGVFFSIHPTFSQIDPPIKLSQPEPVHLMDLVRSESISYQGKYEITQTIDDSLLTISKSYSSNITVRGNACTPYLKRDTSTFYIQSLETKPDKIHLTSSEKHTSVLTGCDSIIEKYTRFSFTNFKPVKNLMKYDTLIHTDEVYIYEPIIGYDTVYQTYYHSIYTINIDSAIITDEMEIDLPYNTLGTDKIRTLVIWKGSEEELYIDTNVDQSAVSAYFYYYSIKIISPQNNVIFEKGIGDYGELLMIDLNKFSKSGKYFVHICDGHDTVIEKRILVVRR